MSRRDFIATPDLRAVSAPLWTPKGRGWHEHFDREHNHKDGDTPHVHRSFPGEDVLEAWPGPVRTPE